ncbi:hypothetical protein [Herbaspirillum aquaticum]|uniref:N-acetyltransferase domain-containing protein n=1 Tax=Herbaspirillum aquaticum TaxID=568783 RepID=A0A225SP68_9BURK|nr:hypothetical protein [Herbaspirillum aquaticum]OWY32866.1 hypothetical protein CEJ45_19410 [Herbaspirillum aquaticum]
MDRAGLLDFVFQEVSKRFPIAKAQFIAGMQRFEICPIEVGGKVVGAVMKCGPEIHIEVSDAGRRRWASKGFIRGQIAPLIAKYGFAETVVPEGNEAGLNFCKRLGFEESSNSGGLIKLICKEIP